MSSIARRIPRPSVALAVAFVALFTALGGTGYAALKITGKSVVNSTLTGIDIRNKSLGPGEIKPDSLGGSRIDEASLGTVPSAANADAVGGVPAAQLMTKKTRAVEIPIPGTANFGNNALLATSSELAAGTWVLTADFTYDNDDAVAEVETCTLQVPGDDDTSNFTTADNETVMLQKVVTSESAFLASVSCTADGDNDVNSGGNIIAVRVD